MNKYSDFDKEIGKKKDLINLLPNFLIWDIKCRNEEQDREINIPQNNLFNVNIF